MIRVSYFESGFEQAPLPPLRRWSAMLAFAAIVLLGSVIVIADFAWTYHVASVRAQAQALDERIAANRAQIRQLQNELNIRSRLIEQERWAPTLGLTTPDTRQYDSSGGDLRTTIADARRTDIATPAASRQEVVTSCVGAQCGQAPVDGGHGYAPKPRQALDSLIASVLH
jgi:hypothetical protein